MDETRTTEKLKTIDVDIRKYVAQVVEDGYTVIPKSISKEMCEETIDAFRRWEAANPDVFSPHVDADGHYPRIGNLHSAIPELFHLFSKNPLTYRVQEALFGARPSLYTSLFYERGSAQDIHRDTPVFSTKPEHFYLGVWVALEDSDEGNGALNVCPGGHQLPELDREGIAIKRFGSLDAIPPTSNAIWVDYQNAVKAQCAAAGIKPKAVYVNAGDTIIWHPQLPHGGGPIADLTRTRFSLVMHTKPVGVPVYHQDKFFNPTAEALMDSQWWYEEIDGHVRVIQPKFSFDHKDYFEAASLKQPAPITMKPSKPVRAGFLHRLLGR
ncbi:hypothetical protein CAL28_10755 [Bordetella genomosp. 11]|uniref:Phytanoyl-CoA dioxygenase n=2 Tax=Bordetella genomosp. 11 TaxID=1416808 RepID=A0A261UEE5_9BORD|nr:hypothetical protein CAL28_10755 [Bordetella genomosp. 11]